jgi:hypothetical protein
MSTYEYKVKNQTRGAVRERLTEREEHPDLRDLPALPVRKGPQVRPAHQAGHF